MYFAYMYMMHFNDLGDLPALITVIPCGTTGFGIARGPNPAVPPTLFITLWLSDGQPNRPNLVVLP
jgi:hypothetical protein